MAPHPKKNKALNRMNNSHILILSSIFLFACDGREADRLEYNRIPVSSNALISPHELRDIKREISETVYVSVYSNIYNYDTNEPISLQALISIRNTDAANTLVLTKADYYDVNGKLIRSTIETPVSVGPLGTYEWVVKTSDLEGGSGAKFLIEWQSDTAAISRPVVENLTADLSKRTGISFVNHGVPLSKGMTR